jgi:hypothetical protein
MHTFEKVGVILLVAACLCVGHVAYFSSAENQLSFLALMAAPIFGVSGTALLLRSKKLKKPLVILLAVIFCCLVIDNHF